MGTLLAHSQSPDSQKERKQVFSIDHSVRAGSSGVVSPPTSHSRASLGHRPFKGSCCVHSFLCGSDLLPSCRLQ